LRVKGKVISARLCLEQRSWKSQMTFDLCMRTASEDTAKAAGYLSRQSYSA
jgi:hypothetical protein